MYQYALPTAPPSKVNSIEHQETLTTADGSKLELGKGARFTLLDFTSGECGCSQFIKAHVQTLETEFRPRGVQFVHVIEGDDPPGNTGIWVKDPHGLVARRFAVGATPGAVVLDEKGHVVFSGTYNRARFCDAHETAFVQLALTSLLSGREPAVTRTAFYGCAVPRS